jgi:hypothetical protein
MIDTLPTSGTTETTVYTSTKTFPAGGQIRITASNAMVNSGGLAAGTMTLRLKISGTTIKSSASMSFLITDDGEEINSSTANWTGVIDNVWSGSVTITITRQRSGTGGGGGYTLPVRIEKV